jgi:cell division septation protein DedD
MGGNARRGGGERVLESRHLIGLFLVVVVLCCVFFTLGYVMGRTEYGPSFRAAAAEITRDGGPARAHSSPPSAPDASGGTAASGAGSSSEWDFYSTKKPDAKLEPPKVSSNPAKPATPGVAAPAAPPKPAAAGARLARYQPPRIPRGAVILQLAALTRESDALALADALQQKQFPAFVVTPTADNLYRVQVGPYADLQSANLAKRSLEREGFKAILKR